MKEQKSKNKQNNRLTLFIISALFLFLSAVNSQAKQLDKYQDTYRELEIFSDVLSILQKNYVDEVENKKLFKGAINGMLNSLDPHSSYLDKEDFNELKSETRGDFEGIGVSISVKDGVLTVVSAIEGAPADKAGVKPGDQIIRINNQPTENMTFDDTVKLLRGKRDSKVNLSIHRPGENKLKTFEITRGVIPLNSVKSMWINDNILYLRITNFIASTDKDVQKELTEATKEEKLQGLILDLRNNPGGLLKQAVAVSDLFLDKGVIVSTRGREPRQNSTFRAHKNGFTNSFPMVVLIDNGSASAAEIVAGALKDNKRAITAGTTTFGKGSVQTVIPLANGAGIRLTTARYYTPSGRSIQETGIKPDIVVPWQNSSDRQKNETEARIREKDLPGHLVNKNNSNKTRKKVDKKTANPYSLAEERLEKDNQLRTAKIILESLLLSNNMITGQNNRKEP